MKLKRSKNLSAQRAGEHELPNRLDTVTVVKASGERMKGRVSEREGNSLVVVLTVTPDRPLGAKQLEGMTLEVEAKNGYVKLEGSVALEQEDTLRFSDLQTIGVVQRREYVRAFVNRQVKINLGPGRPQTETHSLDVSGSGIRLAGPEMLEVGDRVELEIEIADKGEKVHAVGTVVRVGDRGDRAVAFDSISNIDQRRLIRFVFDCLRMDRRRGLKL